MNKIEYESVASNSVNLYLAYGGAVIASYEFTELSDANDFILKMKAAADASDGCKVLVSVRTEVLTPA